MPGSRRGDKVGVEAKPTVTDLQALANNHAIETEAAGRLHPTVVSALTNEGVFRRWVAEDFGGAAWFVNATLDEIETLSVADGTTGWCVMIANTTALTSHHLPTRWAQEIYGDPLGCTGGFGMPAATGVVTTEGLEVTGRWSWGSGTDHCSWIGGGVRIIDNNGDPAAAPDGATTPFAFFSPDQVELLGTWQVSGLKGTASTDYSVTKALVPHGRWAQLIGGQPQIDTNLGRFPFFGALGAGVASVLLGLATRATQELESQGAHRFSGSSKPLAERAPIQADLVRAQVAIAQGRSHLRASVAAIEASIAAGDPATNDQRVALRIAASGAAERAVEAVDLCYHAVGGAAIFTSNPLQRVFRDAHVAMSHGMIAPRTFEAFGRYRFGLPTSTAQF